jgi:hypothetical protein
LIRFSSFSLVYVGLVPAMSESIIFTLFIDFPELSCFFALTPSPETRSVQNEYFTNIFHSIFFLSPLTTENVREEKNREEVNASLFMWGSVKVIKI